MTGDEVLRHAQLAPHTAHLVLEEPLQRLAELQVHLLGQSAYIVMALDDLTSNVQTLNAVRIDGALSQPADSPLQASSRRGGLDDGLGLFIEHLHEVAANDFALLFGLGNACQISKEFL